MMLLVLLFRVTNLCFWKKCRLWFPEAKKVQMQGTWISLNVFLPMQWQNSDLEIYLDVVNMKTWVCNQADVAFWTHSFGRWFLPDLTHGRPRVILQLARLLFTVLSFKVNFFFNGLEGLVLLWDELRTRIPYSHYKHIWSQESQHFWWCILLLHDSSYWFI
jgi:hypothetical protein